MVCPLCNTELKMSERSGIEIDYCPKCRGVWLEKGELDKIIERTFLVSNLKNSHDDNDNRSYVDKKCYSENKAHENEKHYGRKKPGSFLGDLFDF